ncbi:diacylglycerol kinase family protein [soil metagenome]
MVNPSAGRGRAAKLVPEMRAAFERHELEHEVVVSRSEDHARAVAVDAANAGSTVVVMSGDGLVGQIGGLLAETGATMGVLCGGRGNDFARVMEIPEPLDEAVGLLAERPVRSIDVGEVNGKRFLCIASCGVDSDANRIANETHVISGELVYVYAALRALAAWKPARFTVTADEKVHEFTGYSVAVGNSRSYGGGMPTTPEAELDDGALDIVTSEQTGKLKFLVNLPKVFKGTHIEQPSVSMLRARKIRIEADRPFAVFADGDHQTDLPATLGVLPSALRVIAPLA